MSSGISPHMSRASPSRGIYDEDPFGSIIGAAGTPERSSPRASPSSTDADGRVRSVSHNVVSPSQHAFAFGHHMDGFYSHGGHHDQRAFGRAAGHHHSVSQPLVRSPLSSSSYDDENLLGLLVPDLEHSDGNEPQDASPLSNLSPQDQQQQQHSSGLPSFPMMHRSVSTCSSISSFTSADDDVVALSRPNLTRSVSYGGSSYDDGSSAASSDHLFHHDGAVFSQHGAPSDQDAHHASSLRASGLHIHMPSAHSASHIHPNGQHSYPSSAVHSPCDSPFGMTHALNNLAVGTPDGPGRKATQLSARQQHSASVEDESAGYFDLHLQQMQQQGPAAIAANHSALLALSHGHDDDVLEGMHAYDAHSLLAHHASSSSLDLAYSLAAPPLQGAHGQSLDDATEADDATPMPPSAHTFEGPVPLASLHAQPSPAGSASQSQHTSPIAPASAPAAPPKAAPATPFAARLEKRPSIARAASGHGTPASASTGNAPTPDALTSCSPFDATGQHSGSAQSRLHRSDSIDSFATSFTSPAGSEAHFHSAAASSASGKPGPARGSLTFQNSPFARAPTSHMLMQSPGHMIHPNMHESPMTRAYSTPSHAPGGVAPSSPAHGASAAHRSGDFVMPTTPASAMRPTGSNAAARQQGGIPFALPSTPVNRGASAGIPQSAPGASGFKNPLDSPVSIGGTPSSVGKHKRSRSQRVTSGLPPLVVSSQDKVHACWCGKRFKRMEHLRRHDKVHTQEKPYACPYSGCGKAFGRTDNLSQHIKTHYRPNGFMAPPPDFLASTAVTKGGAHDPHAAAAAAAAAAISANMSVGAARRRSTISEGVPAPFPHFPANMQHMQELAAPFASPYGYFHPSGHPQQVMHHPQDFNDRAPLHPVALSASPTYANATITAPLFPPNHAQWA